MFGFHHHYTEVGVAPIDVVLSLVIAYRRCPHTIAVLGLTAEVCQQGGIALIKVLQGITHNLPVHQIFRVEYRQSGGTVETRGRHIVILSAGPYADVGIRIVGINNGVGIGAVTIIGRPYLRLVLWLSRYCQCPER